MTALFSVVQSIILYEITNKNIYRHIYTEISNIYKHPERFYSKENFANSPLL